MTNNYDRSVEGSQKSEKKMQQQELFSRILLIMKRCVCEYNSVNMIAQRYVCYSFYPSGTS
jgi:hypothetical protein